MGMGGRGWTTTGLTVAASVVLALSASACSSGTSTASPSTTLSGQDAFRAQATAVCSEMRSKAAELNKTLSTATGESQMFDSLDQQVTIIQDAVTKLKQLTPDPADATAVKAYVADLDDLVHQSSTWVTAQRAGDEATATAAQTAMQSAQTTVNGAATSLGLDGCAIN